MTFQITSLSDGTQFLKRITAKGRNSFNIRGGRLLVHQGPQQDSFELLYLPSARPGKKRRKKKSRHVSASVQVRFTPDTVETLFVDQQPMKTSLAEIPGNVAKWLNSIFGKR